jgi:hypothetical protein
VENEIHTVPRLTEETQRLKIKLREKEAIISEIVEDNIR